MILNEAFQKLSEAQQSPQAATFDNPLWREAITLGHDALDAQPGNLDALHFLATTYGYINWFSRAWENWLAYFAAGGTVEAADMRDSKKRIYRTIVG